MRSLRLTLTSAALALLVLGQAAAQAPAAYRVPAAAPANIKRAVESPARPAEQRARDADRKPAETLMLAEIAEGERVVELAAFGHYWTNMLVEAVGSSGQVAMVDMPWTDRFGGEAARAFDTAHANATYTQAHYNQMQLPTNVDAVMMVQFYHDLKRATRANRRHGGHEQEDSRGAEARRHLSRHRPQRRGRLGLARRLDAASHRPGDDQERGDGRRLRARAGQHVARESGRRPQAEHARREGLRGKTDQAVLVFRKPAR